MGVVGFAEIQRLAAFFWCSFVSMMSELVLACVLCWNGRRANGSALELAVSATMVWRRWNNGMPVTVARVESLRACERSVKLLRSCRPP